jgi:hypothetical protein
MRPIFKISAAALGLAAMLGLSACNNSDGTPVTANSVAQTTFAYACPIAIAIQASAVILTVAEKTALGIAVVDCNTYNSQGIAGFTTPAIVAQAVVEAIFAIQGGASFTALAPELQHRIIVGHHKLNLALSKAHMSGFEAGTFLAK